MGSKTGISWTDATWNPWQGCTKVSAGCQNCYMYREKEQYGQDPFKVVRSSPATFNAPLKWARTGKLPEGSRIFVCSWSDFFHKDADPWRAEAWEIIRQLPQYSFLIPTKRIEHVIPADLDGLKNIWLGASVENQETADKRIPILLSMPAQIKVRWLSVEPMLEKMELGYYLCGCPEVDHIDYSGYPEWCQTTYPIDWCVVGGESGSGCRPMEIEWARDLLRQCQQAHTPYFLKQLGGWPNTRHELSDFPEDLRIREFPR
jgi:protein gp37